MTPADTEETTPNAAPPAPPAPPAPEPAPTPIAEAAPTEEPAPEYIDALEAARRAAQASTVEGKDWTGGALVIVGAGQPAKSEKRPVIIVEARDDQGALIPSTAYSAGGDLYVQMDPDTDMGVTGPVCLVGRDVEQLAMWGMSPDVRFVCVGPAHPAYVGINLAYSRGARQVEVRGLTDFWKERLQPYIDRIKTDSRLPAADLDVTLT